MVPHHPSHQFIVLLQEDAVSAVHLQEYRQVVFGAVESVRPDGGDRWYVLLVQFVDVHVIRAPGKDRSVNSLKYSIDRSLIHHRYTQSFLFG